MYNRIQALIWQVDKEARFVTLDSDYDVTELQRYLIGLALDQADNDSQIQVTGDENLRDGLVVNGVLCEDACKRWFEIYSIEYIGAEYAALIGGK